VDLPHPVAGTVRTMGVPIRLHGTPGAATMAPPTLGEHTEQVLTRILGYRRADVARFRAAGVV